MPHALCLMPHVSCLMPYALCLMSRALCLIPGVASKRGREALWEARLLMVFSAAFTMSDDLEASAADGEAEAETEAEGQSEAIGALATPATAEARVDAGSPASPRGWKRHICVCICKYMYVLDSLSHM